MPQWGPDPSSVAAAQPMIQWIHDAPPAELATALMPAFGQPTSGTTWLLLTQLEDWMFRGYAEWKGVVVPNKDVDEPLLEALQLLEHSELVMIRTTSDRRTWVATRLGRTTLAEGKDAVRQRIKDRTGQ